MKKCIKYNKESVPFYYNNPRAGMLSIGNDLADKYFYLDIRGETPASGPGTGYFPYLDTFGFSMGGLITRVYRAETGNAHNMVICGTPNHGTFGIINSLGMLGLDTLIEIVKIWTPGTADLLAYDDRWPAFFSGNERLHRLNTNPWAIPSGDLSLFAGTDSSLIGGDFLEKPNDCVVPVSSVFCRTSNNYDGEASLLQVSPKAEKYEYEYFFNHHNFGKPGTRIIDIGDLEEKIWRGLSDWVVAESGTSEVTITPITDPDTGQVIDYYVSYAAFELFVEFNTFEPEQGENRTSRDIDRIALVIYAKDENGQWHIAGEYVDAEGNILKSDEVKGNSKVKWSLQKMVVATNASFQEAEDIKEVVFEMVTLYPGQNTVPKEPSATFGIP